MENKYGKYHHPFPEDPVDRKYIGTTVKAPKAKSFPPLLLVQKRKLAIISPTGVNQLILLGEFSNITFTVTICQKQIRLTELLMCLGEPTPYLYGNKIIGLRRLRIPGHS